MESSHSGWWRRHGWTVALLLTAFGISFAIRTIWAYPIIAQWGPLFTYGGGSDSYYHSRVMAYIALNHTNLVHDSLLKFPFGEINPREPLFDWMNGVLGVAFAPLFGGNPVTAGSWFLDLQAPLWASLAVFPIYLIGREISGRRTGLVAALIFPFLSASIDSTIFGYANYLSFYTFIILVVIYSYLRTVKAVGSRRWVESYRHPRSVLAGLRGFLRTERTAVKWAVFTGVSLGALALAWQGWTYAVVVIGVSVFLAMIIERFRRVDSFGLYVSTWIVGLVGFPMAMPYYIAQSQFRVWFDLPLLLFFGVLLLLLPFLFLRDVPWIFSIPTLGALVAGAAGVLAFVEPTYFTNIVTGQGYFVKTLIYSTVAEAQAPSIDQLIIAYGVVTFFLAFVGLAIFLYLTVHGRFQRVLVVFLVFAVLSIYLPISAAKFFLLGAPAFALLPAEAIVRAIDVAGYPELRRTVASLSDRRSQFAAFRKAFKVRHVLVLALVIGLLLPNVWIAIDAGIPGNSKSQFSSQIASSLPTWLQPNRTNPSSYYLGAAGSSLDTPNQYDSAGYNWLSQQDTNLPPSQRPAFISWWDYGFQAIAQGDHPSVADNFQNGIDPAGQFLLSQNESQAIAVLVTTLLQAEQKKAGLSYLPAPISQILTRDGLPAGKVNSILVNTSADYALVVAHPERYLPVDASTLTDDNAMFLAMEYYIATTLPLAGVAQLYNDLQALTGWSISYAMSDSRLFPFGPTATGIYYAPADLTGRVIGAGGIPTTFFNVTVVTTQGTFPAGKVPPGASVLNYSINYFAPFYNSMIYHIYIGYNGTDIGLGPGIPGFPGTATGSSPIMPGWMLSHFQVVYKTAYYCPQSNATSGASCFSATNYPTAVSSAAQNGGTADTTANAYFSGGESILQYYPGQPYRGVVQLPDGTPVSGVRVTVDDGWGIPHMTTFTAKDGSFSVILPPGSDTVNVTTGSLDGLRQQGTTLLKSVHIDVLPSIGLSFDAPTLVQPITLTPATFQGYVYWNANNSSAYVPSVDSLVPGAQVVLWGPNGLSKHTAIADASASFYLPNIPPGLYNYSVLYGGRNYSEGTVTLTPGLTYNATVGLSPGVFRGTVLDANRAPVAGATVTLSNASGIVASTLSNDTGGYQLRTIGAGNYTLTASGPESGWRSPGAYVSVTTPGSRVTTNLTERPTSTVTLTVTADGAPAAGIPVRFVPVAEFNASASPVGTLENLSGNASVYTTSATGTVTAALPPGTYSVYAVGYVGTSVEAGLLSASVDLAGPTYGSLALAPALRLSGTVASAGASGASTAVVAYAAGGGSALTWAGSNGSYAFLLPSGTYTLYSLTGAVTGSPSVTVALASIDLTDTASSFSLSPVPAVLGAFTVGSRLPNGTLFPAPGASVTVSVGSSGSAVPSITAPDGSVVFYLPSSLPGGETYCIRAIPFGFSAASSCGISPNGLEALTQFPVSLENISVSLTVLGLPSGTSVTVNLTAESESAVSRLLTGGPTFELTLPPGVYGVGARATTSGGQLYLPSSLLSTVIPLGAAHSNLTLVLLPQIVAKGAISPPASVPSSRVNITLSSPMLNLTLNGSKYASGFYATPGPYTAYANVTAGGVTYANLTKIVIASNGAIATPLVLDTAGVEVTGTLVNGTGHKVPLVTTLTLRSSEGGVLTTSVTNGSFSLVLPPGVTYYGYANASATAAGPNGTFDQSWTNAPGTSCSPIASARTCLITMVATTELEWINGSLSSPGFSGAIAGTVTLMGPYPSTNLTIVPVASGTFSVRVLPGAYDVYASGTVSGATRAAFGNALALPSNSRSLVLSLVPTWTATIQLTPPDGSSAGVGPVTLTLSDAFGHRIVFSGLSPTSSLALALPVGQYRVSASANGSYLGFASVASASTSFTVANGNAGAVLSLAYAQLARVAGTLVSPLTVTLRAGQSASFAFTVENTGNVPVTITPTGTPSYWTFNFSFSALTLAPGASVSGEVEITVPAGTAVNHPGIAIEFTASNGTVLGRVSPAPVLHVIGYYGVKVGPSNSPVQVGPNHSVVPFYVDNTGNTFETVALSVVDQPRLAGLGWTATLTNGAGKATSTANLAAGDNLTFFVALNATGSVFLAPGTVTVNAAVVNASGSVQATAVLPISFAKVQPQAPAGGTPLTVTGPSIGTAPPSYPVWLVPLLSFVPAIALALGIVAYRWWRTRRWTRR